MGRWERVSEAVGDSGVGAQERGLEEKVEGGGRDGLAPPSATPPARSLCVWESESGRVRECLSFFFPEARVSNNVAAGQSWRGSSMPLVCHRRAVDPESARNQTTAVDIVPFRATFDSKVLQSQANRDRQEQGTCRQEMRSFASASARGSAL